MRRKAVGVAMTLAVLVLFVVVLVAVFLGGGIVEDIAGAIGLGDAAADVWRSPGGRWRWPRRRWPTSVVYAYAPATEPPQWRWLSPGAAFGVLLWLLASAGFAVYLQNFSNFGAVYGAAGAVVVLLLWLFISANAFLLGAQFDAELDREKTAGRGAAAAQPARPRPTARRLRLRTPRAGGRSSRAAKSRGRRGLGTSRTAACGAADRVRAAEQAGGGSCSSACSAARQRRRSARYGPVRSR